MVSVRFGGGSITSAMSPVQTSMGVPVNQSCSLESCAGYEPAYCHCLYVYRYLGKKFVDNAPELFPKDLKQCAAVDTWLEVEAQNFNPPANALVAQLVLNPILGQPVDTDVVAKNVQILEEVLDVYEKKLAERPYIAGQHFSIADISHMPLTHLMIAAPTTRRLFDDRHYLHEWWKKISERPAWQRLNPKTQAGQQQAQK